MGSRDVTLETSFAATLSGCVSYSIGALPSVLDLTLGKALFAECQIKGTRQTYFFVECFFFSTRQRVCLLSAIILSSVFLAALSKRLVC